MMEVCYIYAYEDSIMKHTLFEKERRRSRKNGKIMDGVNLFKIYCIHIWNYHSETPRIINAY
jgi:hypothetical protein